MSVGRTYITESDLNFSDDEFTVALKRMLDEFFAAHPEIRSITVGCLDRGHIPALSGLHFSRSTQLISSQEWSRLEGLRIERTNAEAEASWEEDLAWLNA